MSFRFVHAADLHLDSPFRGVRKTEQSLGKLLHRATFDAFTRLVDLCIDEKVDALVVAGDVYDGADRSLQAQLAFQAGLFRLEAAGIRSFIAHGNHDPLDGWQAALDLPPGAHRFGSEPETVRFQASSGLWVAIHGYSYPQRAVYDNVALQFPPATGADVEVGVLHATVGTRPGYDPYAPCALVDLEAKGYDYWALGHVHEREVLRAAHPAVAYPGNPQGRHLKEQGPRGVYLVELARGAAPRIDFRAVDVARWARIDIAAGPLTSEQQLIDTTIESITGAAAAAEGRFLLAAARFNGASVLHANIGRPGFTQEIQEHVNGTLVATGQRAFLAGIEDATLPVLEGDDEHGAGFIAEVLRLAAEPGAIDGGVGDGLDDLWDHPAVRRLPGATLDVDNELMQRALALAVDALREGDR